MKTTCTLDRLLKLGSAKKSSFSSIVLVFAYGIPIKSELGSKESKYEILVKGIVWILNFMLKFPLHS
jgi:hypothetical protein